MLCHEFVNMEVLMFIKWKIVGQVIHRSTQTQGNLYTKMFVPATAGPSKLLGYGVKQWKIYNTVRKGFKYEIDHSEDIIFHYVESHIPIYMAGLADLNQVIYISQWFIQ